jgi:calcineurin-like phosphoesterase family protein
MKIFVTHVPPLVLEKIPIECDLVLTGHVHEKWTHLFLREIEGNRNVFIMNVGVDVWNFMPVDTHEILSYKARVIKMRGKK